MMSTAKGVKNLWSFRDNMKKMIVFLENPFQVHPRGMQVFQRQRFGSNCLKETYNFTVRNEHHGILSVNELNHKGNALIDSEENT